VPASKLLTSFIVAPAPFGPQWWIVDATFSNTGRHASRSSAAPPTSSPSVPASAWGTERVIAVSSTRTPRLRPSSKSRRPTFGWTVLKSAWIIPSRAAW
jgi:hypothetical protein